MPAVQAPYRSLRFFQDLHPPANDFAKDVVDGLSAPQKVLNPKYFYDERGSELFTRITDVEEYYPPRTERSIFETSKEEIAASIGPNAAIFEYGSGASEKIAWLINALDTPAAYIAMDISKDYLLNAAEEIAQSFSVPTAAICADFNNTIEIPKSYFSDTARWCGYFPGSTLGNFTPENAKSFIQRAAHSLGEGAGFLLGIDLVKDDAILNAAYNDKEGVTAQFNLNLLYRMRRELDALIDIDAFEHLAFFNREQSRIEMHLRAKRATEIIVNEQSFAFGAGETIHTESSYKYTSDMLADLIAESPWRLERQWTDPQNWYAACYFSNS